MTSTSAARGGILSRVRRILWWTVLAVIAVTVAVILCLRWISPPTSAFMVERRLASLVGGRPQKSIRYRWTDWGSISPEMQVAAVAAEDQNFPHHWGFDLESILDALQKQGKRRRLRGASTITQQVARNLFLWPGRSYVRKGLEAYFTVFLELLWPKRRILEVYLNVVELGDGTYGVLAAARTFFGKGPAELTRHEAALLASALPNPIRLDVSRPTAHMQERARWIEEQVALLGGPAYLRGL